MKKAIFIAMAALVLLTAQCKKNEPKPEEKVMVPITGTVDFGGGSKTEITTTGYITPVVGDKIYIYSEDANVGYMNCTRVNGQQFECSGEIRENCLGTTCTFMYLGTGSTDAYGNPINDDNNGTSISFADQTGVRVVDDVDDKKISGLDKFHVGSCIADVSEAGTVTLPMLSKMAIAYFQLEDGSGNPIADMDMDIAVSGVSATATINKAEGTLTGSGTGTVTVHADAQGCFYMALIPQSNAANFSFAGDGKVGQRTFANGIRPCCFYSEQGLGDPLKVTMEPAKFTVGMDGDTPRTVEFAPGNLYWDGSAFHFEANQWSTTPASDGTWDASHVSHFYWSKTGSVAYAESFSYDGALVNDVFFTNSTEITANSEFHVNGESGTNTWRTLSKAEWDYLLGTDAAGTSSRTNASSLRALKELDGYKGLVILPDGTGASIMNSITSTADLASYGAVFLPAAGFRYDDGSGFGRSVQFCNVQGHYWSSDNDGYANSAYNMSFSFSGSSNAPSMVVQQRGLGFTVRLVR